MHSVNEVSLSTPFRLSKTQWISSCIFWDLPWLSSTTFWASHRLWDAAIDNQLAILPPKEIPLLWKFLLPNKVGMLFQGRGGPVQYIQHLHSVSARDKKRRVFWAFSNYNSCCKRQFSNLTCFNPKRLLSYPCYLSLVDWQGDSDIIDI